MFLSDEQARARLNSKENLANRFGKGACANKVTSIEVQLPGKNRPNLTREERTEIATRADLGESQEVLAREFEITTGNVSHIKTRRNGNVDEEKVTKQISEVRDKALDRLMASMGLLSDDKMSSCSAKDLSVIAANMGRVIDKSMPKDAQERITLVVYSPELRNENSFDTREV